MTFGGLFMAIIGGLLMLPCSVALGYGVGSSDCACSCPDPDECCSRGAPAPKAAPRNNEVSPANRVEMMSRPAEKATDAKPEDKKFTEEINNIVACFGESQGIDHSKARQIFKDHNYSVEATWTYLSTLA